MVVVGLEAVFKPWERTVDSRSSIASAPLSNRASEPVFATLADNGADLTSQASWSRFSPVTPRRVISSASDAAIARAPFLFLLLVVIGFGLLDDDPWLLVPEDPRL